MTFGEHCLLIKDNPVQWDVIPADVVWGKSFRDHCLLIKDNPVQWDVIPAQHRQE